MILLIFLVQALVLAVTMAIFLRLRRVEERISDAGHLGETLRQAREIIDEIELASERATSSIERAVRESQPTGGTKPKGRKPRSSEQGVRDVHEEIRRLSAQGMSADRIAASLGIGVGEVQLILGLSEAKTKSGSK